MILKLGVAILVSIVLGHAPNSVYPGLRSRQGIVEHLIDA